MPNLTAIGLYANGMPFCVTAEIDNHELVQKVMDIVFNGMTYTVYKGYIASAEEKYKQALKFTLLDLAKHHLYRDLEVEQNKLTQQAVFEAMMSNTDIEYEGKLSDLKKKLSQTRKSLGLASDNDADGAMAISLQNEARAIYDAWYKLDREYDAFIKVNVIDNVSTAVKEKVATLRKYIAACEPTQL